MKKKHITKQNKVRKHRTPPQPCQHFRTRVLETRRVTGRYALPGQTVKSNVGPYLRRRLKCLTCPARFTEYAATKSTDATDRRKDRRPKARF